jgi:hypothetical protein
METRRPFALCLFGFATSCATLPEPAGGDQNLPGAGTGPFRDVVATELGNSRSPPYGYDDGGSPFGRDMAVIDADGDPTTLGVIAYVAAAVTVNGVEPTAASPTRSILRHGALDGRSFDYPSEVVLTPDAAWEGDVMGAPAVVRVGGRYLLYYAAAGGIGLATSADSHAFTKVAGPVLAPAPAGGAGGWEQGATPASPGVVQLADGSFRMFYEVALGPGATAIGEASSADGSSWTRLGTGPALAPVGAGDAGENPWDATSVGSPFPMLAQSADGRQILRLFYGAVDTMGQGTIGLAARYGTSGVFERAVSPVYGTSKPLGAREPCVVVFAGFTLLYATEQTTSGDKHAAVAVGVAPATAVLPPPDPM